MKKRFILLLLFTASFVLAQNNVTFRVDLSEYAGSYTQVNLNGTFNNWCGACAVLTDADNDSIYELTVDLPSDSVEFKFTLDSWTVDEQFSPGMPCTKTTGTFTNRFHNVTGDTTLPAYCWESCSECSGTPSSRNVTFQVDLSTYTGSYTNVNLNGTFNNWCGSCATMTDLDGDMIYELMVNVSTDTIEYKFTLDGWTVDEKFAGGEPCTKTTGGFTNRFLAPSGDTILPEVCWESCSGCSSIGLKNDQLGEFEFSPNPTSDIITLKGRLFNDQQFSVSVTDLTGKQLVHIQGSNSNLNEAIDLSAFKNGLYLMNIKTLSGIHTEKILLKK